MTVKELKEFANSIDSKLDNRIVLFDYSVAPIGFQIKGSANFRTLLIFDNSSYILIDITDK